MCKYSRNFLFVRQTNTTFNGRLLGEKNFVVVVVEKKPFDGGWSRGVTCMVSHV